MSVDTATRQYGWLGAMARIIAFVVLFIALALGMSWLFSQLRVDAGGELSPARTAVPALAAVLAGVVLLRAFDRRGAAALGIGVSRDTAPLSLLGLVIGIAGIALATVLLLATGMLDYNPQGGSATGWLTTLFAHGALFAVAAFAEEALFRGYPFQVLVRAAGAPIAIVLSSIIFAWAHSQNPNVGTFALVNIFLAGVMLAVAYLRTVSLWFATTVHLGWNWAMATLFDLPVSGIEAFDTPLYEPTVSGATWFSGGAFGPEGGVVGTLGLGFALLLVLRLRHVRHDRGVLAARPLVEREGMAA